MLIYWVRTKKSFRASWEVDLEVNTKNTKHTVMSSKWRTKSQFTDC